MKNGKIPVPNNYILIIHIYKRRPKIDKSLNFTKTVQPNERFWQSTESMITRKIQVRCEEGISSKRKDR